MCAVRITWSRRQPGNEAVSMRVIYSESEEAAASSASMLGTPMVHSSLPPPSLPPFFLPSSRPPQMLWLFASLKGAKAEEKKTGECSSSISSQSVWWFMHYQDSFKVWFKMECLKSLDLLLKNQMWSRRIKCNPSRLFPLQLLPVQSKDSETLPPPLTHSPPPPPLRGPWVNGSECHCEGTAKKQTPKGTSEVTLSLCGQAMKTFSL